MDIRRIAAGLVKGTKENLPSICAGAAIVGTFATAIASGANTLEANRRLEEFRKTHEEEPTLWDIIRVCGPCYIPTGLSIAATTAFGLKALDESNNRAAAMAGLVNIGQDMMTTYSEKVIETIGEKKEQEIRDAVEKERGQKILENTKPYGSIRGEDIPLELLEGREYFIVDVPTGQVGKGTSNSIGRAENEVNKKILGRMDGEAGLADLFLALGDTEHFRTDHPLCNYPNGWNLDHPLKINVTVDSWNGIPAYYIDYKIWNLMTNTPVMG